MTATVINLADARAARMQGDRAFTPLAMGPPVIVMDAHGNEHPAWLTGYGGVNGERLVSVEYADGAVGIVARRRVRMAEDGSGAA